MSADYKDYIVPCKGCPDRRVTSDYNCHSDCERYQTYKRTRDAKRAEIFEEKNVERRLDEAEFRRSTRGKAKNKWERIGHGRYGRG